MSYYRAAFGTDWDPAAIDREAAARRAYAIGVAEKLGERNRAELESLYDAVDSAYGRSLVELAYQEGRQEATAARAEAEADAAVWAELVAPEAGEATPADRATEGRDALPAAMDIGDLLARIDADSTAALDRPEFLDR